MHYFFLFKRGEIHVADVQLEQIVFTISVPQSIARLQIVQDDAGVDILVTGFAGTQWFTPVERPGQTYRGKIFEFEINLVEERFSNSSFQV